MSETNESTPINELSIEGLERAIDNMDRKFKDALLEIEQREDGAAQDEVVEDAFRYSEAIIEMTKMLGVRKRQAVERMKGDGNESRLDDPNFPSNKHQGVI